MFYCICNNQNAETIMTDNAISKAKIETTAKMYKSFYIDFMPIIQQIKSNVESLKISQQNIDILNNMYEQVERAESLLKQLKTLADGIEEHDK